jgi:hypothetical protein
MKSYTVKFPSKSLDLKIMQMCHIYVRKLY